MEDKKKSAVENTVTVNDNPEMGPLDGANARVFLSKTVFDEDAGTSENGDVNKFTQKKVEGNIKASYELGVVSFSIPEEGLMITARLDEVMQVLFASAGAYRKLHGENAGGNDGEEE